MFFSWPLPGRTDYGGAKLAGNRRFFSDGIPVEIGAEKQGFGRNRGPITQAVRPSEGGWLSSTYLVIKC